MLVVLAAASGRDEDGKPRDTIDPLAHIMHEADRPAGDPAT